MKHSIHFILAFVFCLFFQLESLSAQEAKPRPIQNTKQSYIGSWWDGIEMGGSTMTLHANGTFELIDDMMGEIYGRGTWSLGNNSELVLRQAGSSKVTSRYILGKNTSNENRSSTVLLGYKGQECTLDMPGQVYCFYKID